MTGWAFLVGLVVGLVVGGCVGALGLAVLVSASEHWHGPGRRDER